MYISVLRNFEYNQAITKNPKIFTNKNCPVKKFKGPAKSLGYWGLDFCLEFKQATRAGAKPTINLN